MSNYTTSVMLPSTNGGTAHVPVQNKPIILHLGDDIRFDHETHNRLRENYDVRKPRPEELERSAFIRNLESRKWGAFSAIFRPFWATGNEMRKWDRELIELLPKEMKVMASAGAGYEWVDTECLAEHGESFRTSEDTLCLFEALHADPLSVAYPKGGKSIMPHGLTTWLTRSSKVSCTATVQAPPRRLLPTWHCTS